MSGTARLSESRLFGRKKRRRPVSCSNSFALLSRDPSVSFDRSASPGEERRYLLLRSKPRFFHEALHRKCVTEAAARNNARSSDLFVR